MLDSIKTSDDAMNAQLPSGDKLMDHGSAKPGDIAKVAKALPLLSQTLGQMPSDGGECKEVDIRVFLLGGFWVCSAHASLKNILTYVVRILSLEYFC